LIKNFEQYKLFFDKKLNTTITVGIVWMLLLSVWAVFYTWKINLKTNLLESDNPQVNTLSADDLLVKKSTVIMIWWERYLLTLEKIENL
jgi:hypothetical protein